MALQPAFYLNSHFIVFLISLFPSVSFWILLTFLCSLVKFVWSQSPCLGLTLIPLPWFCSWSFGSSMSLEQARHPSASGPLHCGSLCLESSSWLCHTHSLLPLLPVFAQIHVMVSCFLIPQWAGLLVHMHTRTHRQILEPYLPLQFYFVLRSTYRKLYNLRFMFLLLSISRHWTIKSMRAGTFACCVQ